MLYPAYGTYVGAYVPFPGVSIIGALLGHVVGRAKAHSRAAYYAKQDEAVTGVSPSRRPAPAAVPAAASP